MSELALVLSIAFVLLGLAMPSLAQLTGSRQGMAAARVRGALIHARALASNTYRRTWVVFDVGLERVSVYAEDPSRPGRANRALVLDPLTRSPMTLSLAGNGVGLEALRAGLAGEVGFDSLGVPYDGNGLVLVSDATITMTGGATVRVTRNTGLVTLE